MKVVFGTSCLIAGLLYLGQLISVWKVGLAQRLGLQESPDNADPLSSHLEVRAARWHAALLWLFTFTSSQPVSFRSGSACSR